MSKRAALLAGGGSALGEEAEHAGDGGSSGPWLLRWRGGFRSRRSAGGGRSARPGSLHYPATTVNDEPLLVGELVDELQGAFPRCRSRGVAVHGVCGPDRLGADDPGSWLGLPAVAQADLLSQFGEDPISHTPPVPPLEVRVHGLPGRNVQ